MVPHTAQLFTAEQGSLPGTFQGQTGYAVFHLQGLTMLNLTGDLNYTFHESPSQIVNALSFRSTLALPAAVVPMQEAVATTVMFAVLPGNTCIPMGTCTFTLNGAGLSGLTSNIMALPEGSMTVKLLLPQFSWGGDPSPVGVKTPPTPHLRCI